MTESPGHQNEAQRLLENTPHPYRTDRHRNTQWMMKDLRFMEVEDIREDGENYGKMDKKLIFLDGDVLYYNDSAYASMVVELAGNFPDKIRDVTANYTLDYSLFLMDQDDVDWLTNEFAKESPVEVRIPQGFDVTTTLSIFTELVPEKKLYLRWIPKTTLMRKNRDYDEMEYNDECQKIEKIFFFGEALPVLLTALEQQGDMKDSERIDYLFQLYENSKEQNKRELDFEELNYLFELFDIDKSHITLVPDISFVYSFKNKKPYRIIGPEREELMEKNRAVFKIFRDVVCDVNWLAFYVSMDHFHIEILKAMRMVAGTNHFVRIDLVERCVEKLKMHPHYLMCKESFLATSTPIVNLMGCDDNRLIRVIDAYYDFEHLGMPLSLPRRKKIPSTDRIVAWKYRLLCYFAWNNMFFRFSRTPEYDYLKDLIRAMICPREGRDFCRENMALNMAVLEQLKKTPGDTNGPLITHEPEDHEWLRNTGITSDRLYRLIADPKRKKAIMKGVKPPKEHAALSEPARDDNIEQALQSESPEVTKETLENGRESRLSRGFVAVPEPSEHEDHAPLEPSLAENNENVEPEPVSAVIRKELECCKVLMETQRREMHEVLPMVEKLQEKFRRFELSTQEAMKVKLAVAAEREDKLTRKCQRMSKMCNERREELDKTKEKLKKMEKRESAAQRKLKELQEKEQKKPTREELEEELEKFKQRAVNAEKKVEEYKKKVKEMEREKADQEQLHTSSEERIEELTAEVHRLQISAESSTEQFAMRLSELETYSSDKDGLIRLLKGQLPPETLAEMDIRLPLEMSRVFYDMLQQQDKLLAEHEEANKKVVELKRLTRGDVELHRRADWWHVDYKEKSSKYRYALKENIQRIRADHFITKAELVPQSDYPVLSDIITSALDRAKRAYDTELDAECSICLESEERDWWWCSGCLKKFHQNCIDKAWAASGVQRCPNCRQMIN